MTDYDYKVFIYSFYQSVQSTLKKKQKLENYSLRTLKRLGNAVWKNLVDKELLCQVKVNTDMQPANQLTMGHLNRR